MNKKSSKLIIILTIFLATVLFSIFLKLDSVLQLADRMVDRGWSLVQILLTLTGFRLVFAGLVVVVVLPLVLGVKNLWNCLAEYLRTDLKVFLAGLFSFVIFCALAAGLSLVMGIFKGDLSTVFSIPELRPDADVIGWGYFLLALVPGIWEELAYRGLIQSRLRQVFTTRVSITLSAVFFALFHFSNLVFQPLSLVVPGVVMAFFFGLGWGWLTVRSRSVVPAMISHYLVDALGQIFLAVDSSDPALTAGFFLSLTLLFPLFIILLSRLMFGKDEQRISLENLQAI